MIVIEHERAAFNEWLPQFAHSGARVRGWDVWCAALAQRATPDAVALLSRQAFDAWLAFQIYYADHDWTEFDAWCAAAWWARNVQKGSKPCPPP
jgi:hypothetical protein